MRQQKNKFATFESKAKQLHPSRPTQPDQDLKQVKGADSILQLVAYISLDLLINHGA